MQDRKMRRMRCNSRIQAGSAVQGVAAGAAQQSIVQCIADRASSLLPPVAFSIATPNAIVTVSRSVHEPLVFVQTRHALRRSDRISPALGRCARLGLALPDDGVTGKLSHCVWK